MLVRGHLQKMSTEFDGNQVQYTLDMNDQKLSINHFIGQHLTLKTLNEIHCAYCGKSTRKSYNQGYCYLCFIELARNDTCIMKPELCHFANGTCREPDWGIKHCMQPHLVYLAWSSGLKVGLTKPSQIPTRWIDQGAVAGTLFAQTQSRYHAGLIEDYLKQWYNDRTNWRKMLTVHTGPEIDLAEEAKNAQQHIQNSSLPEEVLNTTLFLEPNVTHLNYPITQNGPVKSMSLDKNNTIEGLLLGIKGQYLILDTGVINIRKHTSYLVELSIL